jgi:hypothetical protein
MPPAYMGRATLDEISVPSTFTPLDPADPRVCLTSVLNAGTVAIGTIYLFADFPGTGEQTVTIANLTGGSGCTSVNPVRDNLARSSRTSSLGFG